jgi:N-acyl-D-aspartate/D-glutamate deacylase
MHDVVLRQGRIIDGTGAPERIGDVAIDGERIASVGGRAGPGRREIDASGLLLTPGFVDVHTHYDGQVSWDRLLEPSIHHGVTTVVMGNCGVGFAPVAPDRHAWLIGLMEGVEDIPGSVLAEGIDWEWESFPEYLDAIERRPHSIDFAAQVPHGALRAYVMGERGADHREVPTEAEIRRMGELVREALEAGAVGFSTSRTMNHKTIEGRHTPSYTATAAELLGIADGLRAANRGVIEVVGDFPDLEAEFAVIRAMAARCARPLSISVAQLNDRPEDWRRMLDLISQANAAGIAMHAQVAPRPVGVMMSLESSFNPFCRNPALQGLAGLPRSERLAKLRDPATRARIAAGGMIQDPKTLYRLADPPCYEPPASAPIAAEAARAGVDPIVFALDAMLAEDGLGIVFTPAQNYAYGTTDHLLEMLRHPHAVPGLGDGGAHVSFISDASFPTYLLTHWVRDRSPGERLPLEFAVRRQTRDAAAMIGLRDRGVLAPGLQADVNVIDFGALRLLRPEMRYDLPAGGKRLVQRAHGYRYTFVRGESVLEDGEPTGATPGRLVRGT